MMYLDNSMLNERKALKSVNLQGFLYGEKIALLKVMKVTLKRMARKQNFRMNQCAIQHISMVLTEIEGLPLYKVYTLSNMLSL